MPERRVRVLADDIFISDGAKTDLGALTELCEKSGVVLLSDPCYPAYADATVIGGRRIVYMRADEYNGFLPLPDQNLEAGRDIPLFAVQSVGCGVYGKTAGKMGELRPKKARYHRVRRGV